MNDTLPQAKFTARLLAVQALYQMEVSQIGVDAVIREFEEHRFQQLAGETDVAPDRAHFARIVRGVVEHQSDIDRGVNLVLKEGWPLTRLDATVRAILRAAACELLACPDIPPRVVLNEYLDVAHAFYSRDEVSFVNGVLDALARRWRGEGTEEPSMDG